MSFSFMQPVRFGHIDAAGIVFYPRYFEMLNVAVEEYFAREVGVSFAEMHLELGLGVPTVSLSTKFTAPSRLGDMLDFQITVERVGRSSMDLTVVVMCGTSKRMEARATLVCMDLELAKSTSWPDSMRPREEGNTSGTELPSAASTLMILKER